MENKCIDLKPSFIFLYIAAIYLLMPFLKVTSDYFLIIGIIIYFAYLYVCDKRFILRFFYMIFYILTNIVGVFIIETNNIYLNELGYFSSKQGSMMIIVVAHLLFIETIRYLNFKDKSYKILESKNTYYTYNGRLKISSIDIIKMILIIVFFTTIGLFINVINKPFFLLKVDRFIYKDLYLSPISDFLTNSYIYIMPIISIYYFKTKDKKVFILLGSIILYLFWIGHKFSYFLDLGYMLALPIVVTIPYKKLNTILSKLVIVISASILIVFFQSFIIWERDFQESRQYINMRLAQQGQMWWAIYGNEQAKQNNLDEIFDEANVCFKMHVSEEAKLNSGIYKMMRISTREDIFNNKVHVKKSRYAYSTQASIYYYFKSSGLFIFSVASGIIYFLINKSLIKNMLNMSLIKSILFARLSLVAGRVLMQSDFDKLFSLENIIILFIIATISLFDKNIKDIQKNEVK